MLISFFSINTIKILYTHKHWENSENKNNQKTYKLQLILASKICYKSEIFKVINKKNLKCDSNISGQIKRLEVGWK